MLLGTGVFTVIETVTLAGWLALVLAGQPILAIVVLLVGLTVEHVISYNVRNGRGLLRFGGLPILPILLIAAIETGTWAGWEALGSTSVLAIAVLIVGLILGHGLELNVVRQRDAFERYGLRLVQSIDITAIETVIGLLWRILVRMGQPIIGAGVLAVGLFVEHTVSGKKRI